MEIRKTFSDHGYEIEAREDFQKKPELTIRKDGVQLLIMQLPPGYGLEAFAAGILVGLRIQTGTPASTGAA